MHDPGAEAATPAEHTVPEGGAAAATDGPWSASLRLLRLPALLLALQVAVLMAARAGLLLLYPEDFAGLGARDVARAFLRGGVFDLSAACTFAGLPLLVMTLPLAWGRLRWLRLAVGWVAFAGFLLLSFAAAADLAYFGYVSRHVGPELRIAGEDLGQLAETAVSEYAPALGGLAVLWAVAFLAWRRFLHRERAADVPGTPRAWALVLLHAWVLVAGARGTPWGNRLTTEDAYEGVPPAATQLVLNGPFCAAQTLLKSRVRLLDFLERDEALRITRDLLISPEETVSDPGYPLFRSRARSTGARPNVVVVMLEGWSATTVDELRAERGLPPLRITPRFSALAREGLLLTRMYASGQRTRVGLTGLLAGVGDIPGVPTLGEGLEDRPLRFLGDLAREEGHATCFLMGFMAGAQREAQIAKATGFDEVMSGETVLGDAARSVHAAPDHLLFEAAGRRIRSLREPFLAFIHTASTHVPYARPRGGEEPFPDDSHEHRYWNAVAYADRSFGGFIDRARADGWFGRTIFIVVSDHIQRVESGVTDAPALFHVPGLVVGPGVPRGVHAGIASHTDLIPTIAHMAGWGAPYAALGRSLLDRDAPFRGAHGNTPTLSLRVESGGWVTRSLESRIASAGEDPDGIERRLLAQTEAARWLILRNRLAPPR